MSTESLQATEAASQAVAKAPRVSLASMEAKIAHKFLFTADHCVDRETPPELKIMTLCILVMSNGFCIVGKAVPASPQNFNKELGEKLAYEDAIRQLWPLEGYALREALSNMKGE